MYVRFGPLRNLAFIIRRIYWALWLKKCWLVLYRYKSKIKNNTFIIFEFTNKILVSFFGKNFFYMNGKIYIVLVGWNLAKKVKEDDKIDDFLLNCEILIRDAATPLSQRRMPSWNELLNFFGLKCRIVATFPPQSDQYVGSSTETVAFQVYEILKIDHEFL